MAETRDFLTPENREDFLAGHQEGLSDRQDKEYDAYKARRKEDGHIPEGDEWYWRGYRAGYNGTAPPPPGQEK